MFMLKGYGAYNEERLKFHIFHFVLSGKGLASITIPSSVPRSAFPPSPAARGVAEKGLEAWRRQKRKIKKPKYFFAKRFAIFAGICYNNCAKIKTVKMTKKERKMKKIISIILTLTTAAVFASCGGG